MWYNFNEIEQIISEKKVVYTNQLFLKCQFFQLINQQHTYYMYIWNMPGYGVASSEKCGLPWGGSMSYETCSYGNLYY